MYNQKKHYNNDKKDSFNINVDLVLNIKPEKYKEFIKEAETWAEKSKSNTTNQIRNFYDELIENLDSTDPSVKAKIGKIKIMLAYAEGRKTIDRIFFENMNKLCDDLMNENDKEKLSLKINNFKQFMEAFVAFNKKHNSKN